MKPSKFILILCIVVLCVSAAGAQEDAATPMSTLETRVAAGTATGAQRIELARAYMNAGRYYEAKRLVERQAESGDADAVAIRDRATEQLNTLARQRVEEAEAAAQAKGATDADRLALADAYFNAGRYRDASKIYAAHQSSDYEVRLRHARALAWAGQHDRAQIEYARLVDERPSPELDLEYGRMLSWMGARRASVARLENAYRTLGTEESAVALANARAWSGDREGAIALLNEYTAGHADAADARTTLAQMQASPEMRIEKLDRMIDADEFNLALRVERARLLYDAGHYSRTLSEIDFIREHARGNDIPDLSDLARDAAARRKEEIAKLDERRRAMEASSGPMTSSASGSEARAAETLELAKAYAGLAAYEPAAQLYDQYLAAVPDDVTARLNYARVLSWDSRYDPARRQYEMVLRELPNRSDIRLEYAQAMMWDADYQPAMATLRSLADPSETSQSQLYNDVPQRAHFNLGQIYRWYGWRDHAVAEQNAALTLDSGFTDAQRELEMARNNRPGSMLEARYTTENTSSGFTMHRGDLEAEHWLNPRLAVQGAVGRHNFEQNGRSADANVVSGGAAFRQTDRMTLRGRAGLTLWEDAGTRPFIGLGATFVPNLQSRAALDYNHYDLIYDVSNLLTVTPVGAVTIGDPISIDDFRAHYDYNSGGFWSALGDASYGRISDDNSRMAAHGLLSFNVWDRPWIALKADGRFLSYDHRTNRYWSPDEYSSLAGVIQVGQDIRDRVFWNAELKVGRSWEGDHSSDLRAWGANVTVPVSEAFDLIGSYNYGRSGRFDSLVGDPQFTNYWQRNWYVGVRVKRLMATHDRRARDHYYYDNRVLGSDIVPPEVR